MFHFSGKARKMKHMPLLARRSEQKKSLNTEGVQSGGNVQKKSFLYHVGKTFFM
ncbi:MAG: hypothetical protein U5L45_15455 [Saprospiraceae bacterium]|nr:hypothetical protein [Saprospiraceae bacterium]